jgi:hypothetical protein
VVAVSLLSTPSISAQYTRKIRLQNNGHFKIEPYLTILTLF